MGYHGSPPADMTLAITGAYAALRQIPIPMANWSRVAHEAGERGVPGSRSRYAGKPIRDTHEVQGRSGQYMAKMRSGQASVARVPHSTPAHALGNGAFHARAMGVFVGVVARHLLSAALTKSFILLLRSDGDPATWILGT